MKKLIIIMSVSYILLFLGQSNVQAAKIDCSSIINRYLSAGQIYKLGDGEKVWGFYKCKTCTKTTSAKPVRKAKRQECVGCGTPHTTEKFVPPAIFKKSNQVYVVNPKLVLAKSKSQKKAAGSGIKLQCPFCSSSHFSHINSCYSCGATFQNKKDWDTLVNDAGTTVKAPDYTEFIKNIQKTEYNEMTLPKTLDELLTRRNQIEQKSSDAQTELFRTPFGRVVLSKDHKKKTLYATSAAATIGTSAMIWYMQTTYSLIGIVSKIDADTVYVSYVQEDGKKYYVDFTKTHGADEKWYLGEEITLYFNNTPWSTPGAERGNGDVFETRIK